MIIGLTKKYNDILNKDLDFTLDQIKILESIREFPFMNRMISVPNPRCFYSVDQIQEQINKIDNPTGWIYYFQFYPDITTVYLKSLIVERNI